MSKPIEPIPAATLVVFRTGQTGGPPEILMVTRSRRLAFAGGKAVFPGGRVDPADHTLASEYGGDDLAETAHRIAAVRETLEETGLAIGLQGVVDAATAAAARRQVLATGSLRTALADCGLSLDLEQIVPFARWLPRGLGHDRIFDTRFYIADLGTGAVDIAVDETENTSLFWTTATDALAAADRGDIGVIFPTRRNLERLALFGSFAEARAHAEATPQRTITPSIETTARGRVLRIPDDLGYPVTQEPMDSALRG